jgi:hypothetical protein
VDLYADHTAETALACACATLTTRLERAHRTGYLRVSAETDRGTGLRIGRAVGELAAVVVGPGSPVVVTVGLNAHDAEAVLAVLRELAS